MRFTVLFANLGRGTAANVKRSWVDLANHAADCDAVCPVEVDEGDKGYSDHELMRMAFGTPEWKPTPADWAKIHEPILVRKGVHVKRSRRIWAGRSVKHQSPARGLSVDVIDGYAHPDIDLVSTHFAAGYLNGTRPPAIKRLLGLSWNATRAALVLRAHYAHLRGRHFVAVMDTNDRGFKRLHRGEVRLFASGPDLGVCVPARGWRVTFTHTEVATFIEKIHQGHKVALTFTRSSP